MKSQKARNCSKYKRDSNKDGELSNQNITFISDGHLHMSDKKAKEFVKKPDNLLIEYVDPKPLPELTTNTIYVQGKNGFNAMKISNNTNNLSSKNFQDVHILRSNLSPVKIAIMFKKFGHSIGYIFQGLLGGIALLHFILMQTYFNDYNSFIHNYLLMLEIYSSIFSLFIAICIISIFDKFDFFHIGGKNFCTLIKQHMLSIISVPLYITVFLLHQIISKMDNELILLHYNSKNISYHLIQVHFNRNVEINILNLKTWQSITAVKDVLSIFGWILVSIDIRKNMLRAKLKILSYYEKLNIYP
ncbi:PREDICTED: uncharacterized protein LOC105366708 [Ceratosolen solmsi marchali]|uniref:Uncharacterized protein LOC105366708 n=1 Tax=Ceratosolen solmsi marchali TaxID=326594 RepID=A0AAJ6YST4_9HYME|nr:PREDICTED: uncharacterized protein LOC105366708 [Ceratosolen solmsi marchali]